MIRLEKGGVYVVDTPFYQCLYLHQFVYIHYIVWHSYPLVSTPLVYIFQLGPKERTLCISSIPVFSILPYT